MSTRSLIAIQNSDGSCKSVYCHWDGYLEYNGLILCDYYKTRADVEKLIALGDISSLDKTNETCRAYHRDMEREYDPPTVYKSRQELIADLDDSWIEYVYLFVHGTWLCVDRYDPERKFRPLNIVDLRVKRAEMLEQRFQRSRA